MKTIFQHTFKILFVTLLFSMGAFSLQTAQAYTTQPAQYQYTDGSYIYQYQIHTTPVQSQYYNAQLQQLLQQIAQLQKILLQMQGGAGSVDTDDDYFGDDNSEIDIRTSSAREHNRNSAILRGQVDRFNRSDYADVWFEYDTSSNRLDKRTPISRIYDNDNRNFSQRIAGLRNNTTYYFRAVAEDEYGEQDTGKTLSFRTSSYHSGSSRDETPRLSTRNAYDVDYGEVRLEGTVDMNDFRNGEIFFVYGEDKYQVQDIADDYRRYSNIYQDGDDLQTYRVARNLNGKSTYKIRISGLDEDTRHYFTLCAGYEDQYNDDVIECTAVRSFTTLYW